MSRAIRPSLLAVLVAGLALATTGCVTFTVDTGINPDGSGTRTIETVLDRSLSDVIKLSGANAEAAFEKQLRETLPANATVRTLDRDGQTYHVARFTFASVADLSRINRGRSRRTGVGAPTASMSASNKFLFTDYEFRETLPPLDQPLTPDEASLVKDFKVKYRLTMPGALTSSNADKTESASTGLWEIPLTSGGSARASSRMINWLPVAGSLLGLAAVIAAAVILVNVLRKRGDNKGPAQAGVES